MCLQCHQGISDAEVERQLRGSLSEPKYELWNATSLNHLIISLCGYNGYECSELSYQLLKGFINFCKNNKEAIPSIVQLEGQIDKMREFIVNGKRDGILEDDLKHGVREKIFNISN